MEIEAMQWKCKDGHPHTVAKVIFDPKDIAFAQQIGRTKAPYTNVHDPKGDPRTLDVIRSRLTAGKLADSAVAKLLRNRIRHEGLHLTVTEYDQNRTDGFKEPDPYDLALTNRTGQLQTIEVRSSFCYRVRRPERMIDALSLYGWYTSANKDFEAPRSWYWQVVFYLRPANVPQESAREGMPIFEDQLVCGTVVAYVVGGAPGSLFHAIGQPRIDDQEGATYQAISPICRGMDCYRMLNSMFPSRT